MNEVELLNWARGPGLSYATLIMVFGLTLRVIEILSLGRAPELAKVRDSGVKDGLNKVGKNYAGVTGDKTFDKYGDVAGTFSVWTFKGGQIVPYQK